MAYNLEPVDRSELADGHRWMFVIEPGGDMYFACDRDGGPIRFPNKFACQVLSLVGDKVAAAAS